MKRHCKVSSPASGASARRVDPAFPSSFQGFHPPAFSTRSIPACEHLRAYRKFAAGVPKSHRNPASGRPGGVGTASECSDRTARGQRDHIGQCGRPNTELTNAIPELLHRKNFALAQRTCPALGSSPRRSTARAPAFTDRRDAEAWLLGASGGAARATGRATARRRRAAAA